MVWKDNQERFGVSRWGYVYTLQRKLDSHNSGPRDTLKLSMRFTICSCARIDVKKRIHVVDVLSFLITGKMHALLLRTTAVAGHKSRVDVRFPFRCATEDVVVDHSVSDQSGRLTSPRVMQLSLQGVPGWRATSCASPSGSHYVQFQVNEPLARDAEDPPESQDHHADEYTPRWRSRKLSRCLGEHDGTASCAIRNPSSRRSAPVCWSIAAPMISRRR